MSYVRRPSAPTMGFSFLRGLDLGIMFSLLLVLLCKSIRLAVLTYVGSMALLSAFQLEKNLKRCDPSLLSEALVVKVVTCCGHISVSVSSKVSGLDLASLYK